jgi:uncharacterized Zn finger protein (UPF0148 family)
MDILSTSCASCGAPIDVPPSANQLSCSHCGTTFLVQRTDDSTTLAEVQSDIKRLQLTQELSALTAHLSSIQVQIRFLKSQKPNRKLKAQIKELESEEAKIAWKVNNLRSSLAVQTGGQTPPAKTPKRSFMKSPFKMGCATFFLVYMVLGLLIASVARDPNALVVAVVIGLVAAIYVGTRISYNQ